MGRRPNITYLLTASVVNERDRVVFGNAVDWVVSANIEDSAMCFCSGLVSKREGSGWVRQFIREGRQRSHCKEEEDPE